MNNMKKTKRNFLIFETFPKWIQKPLMNHHLHYGEENKEDIYYREDDVVEVIDCLLSQIKYHKNIEKDLLNDFQEIPEYKKAFIEVEPLKVGYRKI